MKTFTTFCTALLGAVVGSVLVAHVHATYVPATPRASHEVFAVTNGACPAYATELVALRGRMIVGLPSGGTNAGTVGSAFTNVENRTHTHSVPGLSVSGSTSDGSNAPTQALGGGGGDPFFSLTSHTHSFSTTTGTGTSGTTSGLVPFAQYMFCETN